MFQVLNGWFEGLVSLAWLVHLKSLLFERAYIIAYSKGLSSCGVERYSSNVGILEKFLLGWG